MTASPDRSRGTEVGQHDIELLRGQVLERLSHVGRLDDGRATRLQHRAEDRPAGVVAVDDKQPHSGELIASHGLHGPVLSATGMPDVVIR